MPTYSSRSKFLKFVRAGRYPGENANPNGGWDFEAARYKFLWLPFVSYHREKFDFYFGWRNRGNFGIKININPGPPPKGGDDMLAALRKNGCEPKTLELHCGHYSLELPPFSYVAGMRMGAFFVQALG